MSDTGTGIQLHTSRHAHVISTNHGKLRRQLARRGKSVCPVFIGCSVPEHVTKAVPHSTALVYPSTVITYTVRISQILGGLV